MRITSLFLFKNYSVNIQLGLKKPIKLRMKNLKTTQLIFNLDNYCASCQIYNNLKTTQLIFNEYNFCEALNFLSFKNYSVNIQQEGEEFLLVTRMHLKTTQLIFN